MKRKKTSSGRRHDQSRPAATTSRSSDVNRELDHITKLAQAGQLDEAERLCKKILRRHEGDGGGHHFMALIKLQRNDIEDAAVHIDKALAATPESAQFLNHAGVIACRQRNLEEGIRYYRHALRLQPSFAEAHYNLALALAMSGKRAEPETHYRQTIALDPHNPLPYNGLGELLSMSGRHNDAVDCYQHILAAKPDHAQAWCNLGSVYLQSGRDTEAEEACNRALALNPDYAEAHNNIGTLRHRHHRYREAIVCFRKALDAKPTLLEAWGNLAKSNESMDELEQVMDVCREGLQQFPENVELLGHLVSALKQRCQWQDIDRWNRELIAAVYAELKEGQPCKLSPFSALSLEFTNEQLLGLARNHCAHSLRKRGKETDALNFRFDRAPKKRIRVGYMSADFRNHPVTHLTAGMFACHDRNRFEIFAYSFGPDDQTDYHRRIADGCDQFVEVRSASDDEFARRIFDDGIDILLDMTGYVAHCRTEVPALRPAPVQINYLSYPGTMGAPFIDYCIVDPVIVPVHEAHGYSEDLIYLPDTYTPADRDMDVAVTGMTRTDCNLPADAFVFCCFNSSYKIDSTIFGVWMNILNRVPGSVLWLFAKNDKVAGSLLDEAERHGIQRSRLVFAGQMSREAHLERYQFADLFLDTLTYQAHTTAIDALWCEVPIVTKPGCMWPSRICSSILHAIELKELIAADLEKYENLAVGYATDNKALGRIKYKLVKK